MKTYFTILFILVTQVAFSQTEISGVVTDNKGEPVFAANIYLQFNPQAGSTSDFDGKFLLKLSESELNDTLIVSFIGYKTKKVALKDLPIQEPLKIIIEENSKTLQEVSIIAKEPISEQFSVTKLEALDIYLNPIAAADPLKAITSLPASTTTDESANPSLRGSSAERTRVVVNGVPVYRPVRNSQIDGVGHFSLFNTEIINKQYVYASNPPLTYGNTSAGVVEIETIDELKENYFSLSTGLAHAGLFISQMINPNTFIQGYSNFQFSEAFMEVNRKNMPNLKGFGSKDAGINFYTSLSDKLSFNLFSYGIIEDYRVNFDLFTHNDDAVGEKKRNFNIANLKFQLKKGFISLNNGTNFSETTYQYGNIYSKNNRRQVYTSLNYKQIVNEQLNFQIGLSHDYSQDDFKDSVPDYYYALSPELGNSFTENNIKNEVLEAYVYSSLNLTDNVLLSGGMRKNIPNEDQESYLNWQLGFKYKFSEKQSILLSGGLYRSYSVPNYYMKNYELLKSKQVALDYAFEVNKLKLTAALFYKDEAGTKMNTDFITSDNILTQGAEIYVDYYFTKDLKWTFANTFLDQRIKIEEREYKGEKDLDYFIKTTLSYNNPKLFTTAVTYIGRPGQHYTPVVDSWYNTEIDFYQPYYSTEYNSAQYGAYNNLSINISKYIQYYKQVFVIYASCNNLLNTKNQSNPIYNADYSSHEFSHYQLRTIYFGVVWQLNY